MYGNREGAYGWSSFPPTRRRITAAGSPAVQGVDSYLPDQEKEWAQAGQQDGSRCELHSSRFQLPGHRRRMQCDANRRRRSAVSPERCPLSLIPRWQNPRTFRVRSGRSSALVFIEDSRVAAPRECPTYSAANVQEWHPILRGGARVPKRLHSYRFARAQSESVEGCAETRDTPQHLAPDHSES